MGVGRMNTAREQRHSARDGGRCALIMHYHMHPGACEGS